MSILFLKILEFYWNFFCNQGKNSKTLFVDNAKEYFSAHKFSQFSELLVINFWQIFGITNERSAVNPMTQSSEIPLIRHIYFCFSPVVFSHWWFQTFLASRRPNPKFRARASRALLEARVSAPSVSSRRQSSFFRARNRSAKIGWTIHVYR